MQCGCQPGLEPNHLRAFVVGLTLLALSVSACDDSNDPVQTVTPLPASATVVSMPVEPTIADTTTVESGPPERQPLLTSPASSARTDCDASWRSAEFAGLSVCFPEGLSAFGRPAQGVYSAALTLEGQTESIFIGLSIVDATPVTSGALPSMEDFCRALSNAHGFEFALEETSLQTGSMALCMGSGDAGDGGIDPIEGFGTLPDGHFLQVGMAFGSSALQPLGLAVLETVETR